MVIIVGLLLALYVTKIRLDDLNAEYKSIQEQIQRNNKRKPSFKSDTRTACKSQKRNLPAFRNRIAASRTNVGKIQDDMDKQNRNLDNRYRILGKYQDKCHCPKPK